MIDTSTSKWWISCKKFTVFAVTDCDDRIVLTAPVTRKLVGQPLASLAKWFGRIGGFKMKKL